MVLPDWPPRLRLGAGAGGTGRLFLCKQEEVRAGINSILSWVEEGRGPPYGGYTLTWVIKWGKEELYIIIAQLF